jgi:hypothetical protein
LDPTLWSPFLPASVIDSCDTFKGIRSFVFGEADLVSEVFGPDD